MSCSWTWFLFRQQIKRGCGGRIDDRSRFYDITARHLFEAVEWHQMQLAVTNDYEILFLGGFADRANEGVIQLARLGGSRQFGFYGLQIRRDEQLNPSFATQPYNTGPTARDGEAIRIGIRDYIFQERGSRRQDLLNLLKSDSLS